MPPSKNFARPFPAPLALGTRGSSSTTDFHAVSRGGKETLRHRCGPVFGVLQTHLPARSSADASTRRQRPPVDHGRHRARRDAAGAGCTTTSSFCGRTAKGVRGHATGVTRLRLGIRGSGRRRRLPPPGLFREVARLPGKSATTRSGRRPSVRGAISTSSAPCLRRGHGPVTIGAGSFCSRRPPALVAKEFASLDFVSATRGARCRRGRRAPGLRAVVPI